MIPDIIPFVNTKFKVSRKNFSLFLPVFPTGGVEGGGPGIALIRHLLVGVQLQGLVRVEVQGRAKHYFPAVEREKAARQETRSFLDRVYQGSVGLMVSSMAREKALTKEEIEELYAILKEAEGT